MNRSSKFWYFCLTFIYFLWNNFVSFFRPILSIVALACVTVANILTSANL